MSPRPTHVAIIHAYRSLYRSALRAVHFSAPARYQIRDILRDAFHTYPTPLQPQRVANTVVFLERAATHNGLEHKILRNLLFSRFWHDQAYGRDRVPNWMKKKDDKDAKLRRGRRDGFDATVELLNESRGLCLRT